MTELAQAFNGSDEAERSTASALFARPQNKASGGGRPPCSPTAGTRSAEGPRPVIWSPASSAWGAVLNQRLADDGRAGHGARGRAVHADAAGDRHARADGRRPRATPRRRSAGPTSSGWRRATGGLGRVRPSRVGPVPPRQDQPELLDQRAVRPHRPGLRGDRQDRRASRPRTSTTRETEAFATGRGVGGRALRRHHAARSSTTGTAPTSEGTSLTYASAVAVEEKSVIDYNRGNPDGVLDAGESARASRASRSSPSTRRRGRSTRTTRIFVLDAEWVSEEERSGARAVRGFVQRPENQREGARVRVPARATPTSPWPRRSSPRNGVDPDQPQHPARRPRAAGDDRRCSTSGPSSARAPGCCSCSTCRARWASPPTRRRARPSSTWPRRRPSRRSTSSRTRTRSASASSPPTSPATSVAIRRRRADRADRHRTRRALRRRDRQPVPAHGTPLYQVTRGVLPRGARRRTTPPASTPSSLLTDGAATTTATRRTTRRSSRSCSTILQVDPGRDRQAGPDLPDRLRRGRRPRRAADHRRGHQLGRLQRQRPEDDHQGVHRGREQLLTPVARLSFRDRFFARRWRGRSPRRRHPATGARPRRLGDRWPSARSAALAGVLGYARRRVAARHPPRRPGAEASTRSG